MPEFNIGDVVRVTTHYSTVPLGAVGRVLEVDSTPWIDFGERYKNINKELVVDGVPRSWESVPHPKPPIEQCWCVPEDCLELVAQQVEPKHEASVDEALGLVSVSMRLPVELHEALKAIAEAKGWVLPAVMREALSLYAYQKGGTP